MFWCSMVSTPANHQSQMTSYLTCADVRCHLWLMRYVWCECFGVLWVETYFPLDCILYILCCKKKDSVCIFCVHVKQFRDISLQKEWCALKRAQFFFVYWEVLTKWETAASGSSQKLRRSYSLNGRRWRYSEWRILESSLFLYWFPILPWSMKQRIPQTWT